jgi:hypothetical protein
MPSCFLVSTPLLHFRVKVLINALTGQVDWLKGRHMSGVDLHAQLHPISV